MSFAGAKKLREIVYATENSKSYNYGLKDSISFLGTPLLEKAYLCNLDVYEDTLNMSECSSLLYLDAQKSGFKDVIIANGAPVTTIKLNNPTSLTLTNLTELNNFNIANSSRLQTIELSNIDKNIPNLSKTILEDALVHVDPSNSNDYIDYKITDAVWSINNAAEMEKVTEEDQETVSIKTLDKMLDNIYARPVFGPNKIDRLPYSAAFTGSLSIGANAYSGNNPLQIYNEYITPNKFAGIDMSFEAESAKLYNVVIYDGDGVPFWSKKTIKNTPLNDDFLASGPSGAFDRSKLIKSPTAEYEYKLQSAWKVKYINAEGTEETKILTEDTPIGIDKITSDLSIYPTYSESKRKYKISVKLKHPQTN
jgi:hypothetical protein